MSICIRLAPGVKVRISKRGTRWGFGPRLLRRWTGALRKRR